ncbi:hypothetical protein BVX95_02325 [archaeon D22]|nr:hypothetical protein BVX95_02325 [archaeon D22]
MAFDKSLDKELFGEDVLFDTTKIRVSVYSYNEGPKKLQISRENMNASGEPQFAKLGRMTKEEAEKVYPLIEKALKEM